MAFLTATDGSTSAEISGSTILSAFAFQYGSGTFETWSSTSLTYNLQIGNANSVGKPTGAWTADLTAAIEMAMADVSAVCNVTFTETTGSGADIDYWSYNEANSGTAGFSYGIGGSGVYINQDSLFTEADGYANGLEYGGVNYRTVIHELLHNMGASHPHDRYANLPGVSSSGDTGDFALNQNIYTVMSYNSVKQYDDNGNQTTGWPYYTTTVDQSFAVLGAFDIAFMQTLYGANMSTATGNDTYVIASVNETGTYYKSIWDAGGTDLMIYTGADDVVIDLRAATLDMADGMLAGGGISTASGIYGGFTIANGVVIENATGGDGDDLLLGNSVSNKLIGGKGKDTLIGVGGSDTLKGGGKKDVLGGGNGGDILKGGNGNDKLTGGKGKDTLTGNNGADKFIFKSGHGNDIITDFEDGVDLIKIKSGAASFADVSVTQSGLDTLIAFDGVTILLNGITASDITAADFIF